MNPYPSFRPLLCRSLLVAALLASPLPVLSGPVAGDARFDRSRVGWSEIRMGATKLFLSADADVRWQMLPGTRVSDGLVSFPPGDAIAPGPEVLEISFETAGAGRKSRLVLLMDPVSGAAIQRTQHEYEGKFRQRIYRFGTDGAYHRTRWPVTSAERALPPAQWTRTAEGLRAYPDAPGNTPVVESTGLLYLISAAALENPGDSLDILTFRRRDTQSVRVTVLPPREITVRYDELGPAGAVERRGSLTPVRLSLEGIPTPGQPVEEK